MTFVPTPEVADRRRGISRGPGSAPALPRIPGTSDVDSRGLPRTREGFPGWNGSELKSGRISVNFSPNGRWNSSGWHRPGMARQGGSLKRTIVLSQGTPTRDMQFMCKLLIKALMDRFCDRTSAEEFREVTDRRRGISRGHGSAPALLRIPGTSDVDSRELPRTPEGFPGRNGSEWNSGRISVNFSPNGRWSAGGWHRPGMARQGGSPRSRIGAEEFREVTDRRRGISWTEWLRMEFWTHQR